jgi:hypothetical protein
LLHGWSPLLVRRRWWHQVVEATGLALDPGR